MSSLSTMGLVFSDPHQAYTRLRTDSTPWLPLLCSLLLGMTMMYWWVSTTDFNWLREHMMAANPGMSGEERAGMKAFVNPTAMLWTTQLGTVAGTVVVLAIMALYFKLAGSVLGTRLAYGKWFSFVCWTSLPQLLIYPLMALQIATSNGQVGSESLNLASLGVMLRLQPDNPWLGLASMLDFSVIWSIILAVIGLKIWTGRGTGACTIAAALPLVLATLFWTLKVIFFS